MPLYEYQCENCGDVFEIIQKFVDTPLTVHDKCGGAVHRLLSAPALMFKGSGWYVNDYAKGANNAANGGSKKGESSDHSSSERSHSDRSDSDHSKSDRSSSSSEAKEASSAKSDSGSKTKSSESNSSSTTPAAASTSSSDKK